jgi:hypothetical protein
MQVDGKKNDVERQRAAVGLKGTAQKPLTTVVGNELTCFLLTTRHAETAGGSAWDAASAGASNSPTRAPKTATSVRLGRSICCPAGAPGERGGPVAPSPAPASCTHQIV